MVLTVPLFDILFVGRCCDGGAAGWGAAWRLGCCTTSLQASCCREPPGGTEPKVGGCVWRVCVCVGGVRVLRRQVMLCLMDRQILWHGVNPECSRRGCRGGCLQKKKGRMGKLLLGAAAAALGKLPQNARPGRGTQKKTLTCIFLWQLGWLLPWQQAVWVLCFAQPEA